LAALGLGRPYMDEYLKFILFAVRIQFGTVVFIIHDLILDPLKLVERVTVSARLGVE
jgi:hypothetical protein